MNHLSFVRLGAPVILLLTGVASCGTLHAESVSSVGPKACAPAPTAVTGHHDIDAGVLTVRVYESSDSAAVSLQAACSQAANVVLVNWERGRCADYAVASSVGQLVGDAAAEPTCTSTICPVAQKCAVHITHIPDFVFAQKK